MVSFRCEVADCSNPPRWVLQEEVGEVTPGCICSQHWQELRRDNPHAAYLYSPLAVVRVRERIAAASIEAD